MSPFVIYLLTRCDPLAGVFTFLSILAGLTTILAGMCWLGPLTDGRPSEDELRTSASGKRYSKISWSVFGAILLLRVLIPSNTDIALIIAGSWATNNEQMTKLPDNALRVVNKFMEDYVAPKVEEKK